MAGAMYSKGGTTMAVKAGHPDLQARRGQDVMRLSEAEKSYYYYY